MSEAQNVERFGEFMSIADKQCRRETGKALSPTFRAMMFTMWLREQRGEDVDWPAVSEGLI